MNATELANKLRLKFPKLKDMADSDVIETVSKKYPKIKESLTEEKKSKRKFVLVTKDFSGMGFAIQEIHRGVESYRLVGHQSPGSCCPDQYRLWPI